MAELLSGWPVANAALAVVSSAGVLATEGNVAHEFWLASLTKPLAGLATLVAVEEGALELSSPVPGLPPELAEATLRHLLSHATGLGPDRLTRAAAVGTRRIYSNAGFDLLGSVVAGATEMPFENYLSEAVFSPLGMSSASLTGSPARDGRATVADWIPVLSMLLAGGAPLLDPSTVADATSVQYPGLPGVLPGYGSQADNTWGLGVEIRGPKQPHWTSARNSPETYGHFGQGGTMFWVDPAVSLAVVAMADEPFGRWAIDAWPVLSTEVLHRFG